jgi:5'-methylthioadenosine phosphorylase
MTNMPEAKLAREAEIRYCSVGMVTDYDCWHPDHADVDVTMVMQTLTKNALNAQNMIKEVIKTYKNFSIEKDSTDSCLDTAIITDAKLRTKKTTKKLQYIAGRVLNKK